ncbi:MAG: SDR family NAD(P)-dependent oxidoreductase [Rickettsiales bacterium]|jgi:NAD(P)-dependent dehydrogenase (short-subunit alcohol dehydrogenase family)|nr:SDR family NAD(P)-dependent oxidoreductase [Rickettsiales bacterium]
MSIELKNKIALVTGGISGIGLEIVRQLLSQGTKVIMNFSSNHEQAIIVHDGLEKEFGLNRIMLGS